MHSMAVLEAVVCKRVRGIGMNHILETPRLGIMDLRCGLYGVLQPTKHRGAIILVL